MSDSLKARKLEPPGWQCRCAACEVAVSHGAPEQDRDYDRLTAERDQLLAALTELVECKRLRIAFESFEHTKECLDAPLVDCPAYKMELEYRHRNPRAWAAAERLIAGDKTE